MKQDTSLSSANDWADTAIIALEHAIQDCPDMIANSSLRLALDEVRRAKAKINN